MKTILAFSTFIFSFYALADSSDVWKLIRELQTRIEADKAQVEKILMSGFTDKYNGLRWSINLPGTYTNGCTGIPKNRKYPDFKELNCTLIPPEKSKTSYYAVGEDSEAQMACRKLGGRLPTVLEYKSLFNNFRVKLNGNSIEDGYFDTKKFNLIFGNGNYKDVNSWSSSEQYWTSSVDVYIDGSPNTYTAKVISVSNAWENGIRSNPRMVRCVFDSK